MLASGCTYLDSSVARVVPDVADSVEKIVEPAFRQIDPATERNLLVHHDDLVVVRPEVPGAVCGSGWVGGRDWSRRENGG